MGSPAPILVGWSMGVQVGLELHRDHPSRLSALVAVHGTAGRPLARAFDSGLTEKIAPWVFRLMRAVGRNFGLVGPTLTRMPIVVRSFVELARRLGCMSPDIDIPAFRDMAEGWTRLDLDAYARIFEALGAHDAWDLLPEIETPTLVVAGSLEVVEGATHFGLIEYGHEIADAVERFVARRLPAGKPSRDASRRRGGRSRGGRAQSKILSA